jgi:excisionase family DNA binding protein
LPCPYKTKGRKDLNEILLNGIKVNELLEMFGKLVEKKISDLLPPQKQTSGSDYLTRKEVAEKLKITLPTLHEWTKLGWLQSFKIGKRVLYKSVDVEAAVLKVATFKYKKGGGNHAA